MAGLLPVIGSFVIGMMLEWTRTYATVILADWRVNLAVILLASWAAIALLGGGVRFNDRAVAGKAGLALALLLLGSLVMHQLLVRGL